MPASLLLCKRPAVLSDSLSCVPLPPRAQFLPPGSAPDGFADSYTLSGCGTAAYCGVFGRVAAHCTDPSGHGYCPGGAHARPGWTDATLCDGAPVYQRRGGGADGAVLFRYRWSDGQTAWLVGPSDRLADCFNGLSYYFMSGSIPGPPSYAPDVAGYGWSDPGGYNGVHIVAGGGGGGH